MAGGRRLRVQVAWSPGPRQMRLVELDVEEGATVADAWRLAAAGDAALPAPPPAGQPAGCKVGVWGRACAPERVLHEQDRVEIYRGLKADPKESRRVRYQAHLARWGGPGRRLKGR